jgi:integrase/recombinase XerD
LRVRDLDWTRIVLEDIGRFVAWLRLPADARESDRITALPWVEGHLSAQTVNRKLRHWRRSTSFTNATASMWVNC